MFEDLESRRELYVDPDTVRRDYLARFAEHAEIARRACRNLGIDQYRLTTDMPLELALFDFLHARMRRGRSIRRRSGHTPARTAQGGQA